LAADIAENMGPNELLYGTDECKPWSTNNAIALPDVLRPRRPRQLSINESFERYVRPRG
jgi:hypothetical protein